MGILACAVVFGTIAALTLPAVTTEDTAYQLENGALLPLTESIPPQEAPSGEEAPQTALPDAQEADPAEDVPVLPDDAAAVSETPPAPTEEVPVEDTSNDVQEKPTEQELLSETEQPPEMQLLQPMPLPEAEQTEPPRGELQSGTLYSSDLADFIVSVTLLDGAGNTVPENGMVYVGQDYSISILFSENNISGEEKQFRYDADGYLTYQIPPFFSCAPVPSGTLTDSSGTFVGTYSIDASGLLRVQFIPGYIDSSKASLNITLNSTVVGSASPGMQPIDFGGYIIEVNVSDAGTLQVEKTAGVYDARTHSIDYTVAVTARNGTVEHIAFTDSPISSGLTVDPSTFVYTSMDGLTVYPSQPTTLNAGEGFLVQYRAYLDPSIYQGKNSVSYTAKNKATATGTSSDGPLTAEDTEQKSISTRFLQKSGKDEPSNGRIRWTVTIGDGSTIVDGLTLTDVPGTGLSFDLASGISAVPANYSSSGELVDGARITFPFGADPTQITLPTGVGAYRYTLTYYTTYTLDPGVTSQSFSNTVSASDPAHDPVTVTKETTGHAAGAPPDIQKTVEKNAAGTALHYCIAIDVPGFYGNTGGFYLTDTYTKVSYHGTEYYFGQDIENLSVYTEDALDQIVIYTPYESDPAAYTYRYIPNSDPRTFTMYFNTGSSSSSASNWIETQDCTLYISYDLPLSSQVYTRPDGTNYVLENGLTVGDLMEEEAKIINRGRIYFNEKLLYEESTATYHEPWTERIRKRAAVDEDGIIHYEVIFNNRDASNNTILQKNMKELILHDTLLEPGMSYVDGSLYCDIYNDSLSRIRTVYHYSQPISGSQTLEASAKDFLWYSGDNASYTTLYQYAQHSVIGGTASSTSRLVFRYQVQVDHSSPVFDTTDQTVPLSNIAQLTGILPDDTPLDSGTATSTVDYDTEILKKEVEHVDGSNRADFTITINPKGVNLLADASQMTLLDTMTANLSPVLSSIRVFYQIGGVWEETTPVYTYDPTLNVLAFTLPDDVPIQITYTTLITQTGSGVSIGNSVSLAGIAEYSAVVDAEFQVNDTGGAAHADNFRLTLLKQASDTHQPLSGAVFCLYGPPHTEREGVPPAGTSATITVGGQTLRYYTSYVTGSNGIAEIETNSDGLAMFSVQGLYALTEAAAPDGYHILQEPICFYADERPSGGLPSIDVLLSDSPVVVANDPKHYSLPETGGVGAALPQTLGVLLLFGTALWLFFEKAPRDSARSFKQKYMNEKERTE